MSAQLADTARDHPSVTVIMTSRERHALTEWAIDTLLRNTRIPFRFIYADVCSPQWLRARLAERANDGLLELVRIDELIWPVQVKRRLVRSIDSKYVAFVDNDVLVSPGWLERLLECAEETGAGIVGPVYLWGMDEKTDLIHMAGGDLTEEREAAGLVLKEQHRHFNKKLGDVELTRKECGFVEFHCMLMRREVFTAPETFNEEIACVHEHIHVSLTARRLGYKTYSEPAAQAVYLVFPPYSLSDLPVFRRRWSHEACESSIRAFAREWGVIDDQRSFGVRNFVRQYRGRVDPVRPSLQSGEISHQPLQESDLKQSLTGLIELARARGYTAKDIEALRSAHWTALLLSNGGYRPCGRPFINHLIGTASILLHYGVETRVVQAALLHAAYTHAPFVSDDARAIVEHVATQLGGRDNIIERAVRAYSLRSGRWKKLAALDNWQDVATLLDVETCLVAMANQAELHLSGEVRATGRVDVEDVPVLAKAREIAEAVGVPGLAETVLRQQSPPAEERKQVSSFRVEGTKVIAMVNPALFRVVAAGQKQEPQAISANAQASEMQ